MNTLILLSIVAIIILLLAVISYLVARNYFKTYIPILEIGKSYYFVPFIRDKNSICIVEHYNKKVRDLTEGIFLRPSLTYLDTFILRVGRRDIAVPIHYLIDKRRLFGLKIRAYKIPKAQTFIYKK